MIRAINKSNRKGHSEDPAPCRCSPPKMQESDVELVPKWKCHFEPTNDFILGYQNGWYYVSILALF